MSATSLRLLGMMAILHPSIFPSVLAMPNILTTEKVLPEGCEHCDAMVPLENGWSDLFYLKGNTIETSPHVYAGKTLCIQAGEYWGLGIFDVHGLADLPVTITNCGNGIVTFDGQKLHPTDNVPRAGTPISIKNCTHLRLTGSAKDSSSETGIIAQNAPKARHGVHVYGGSSYIEVDHIESRNNDYGGIVIRTYPECGGKYTRDTFVQRNTSVHDTVISNVGGEGMYIGTSHYHEDENGYVYGSDRDCPGETAKQASLRGVEVYNNVLINIGLDAIQIGAAVEDVFVHHNSISNFAKLHKYGHSHGIGMNPGSTGDVYNNRIEGPAEIGQAEPITAIAFYGQAESNQKSSIYNNVIRHVDRAFVFYNREDASNQSYDFSFNTVYDFTSKSPTNVYCYGTVDPENQPPVEIQIRYNIFALGPNAVVLDAPGAENGWTGWKAFYGNTNGIPGDPSMACLNYMDAQENNVWDLDYDATTPIEMDTVRFRDASGGDLHIMDPLPASTNEDIDERWYPEKDFGDITRSYPPDQGAYQAPLSEPCQNSSNKFRYRKKRKTCAWVKKKVKKKGVGFCKKKIIELPSKKKIKISKACPVHCNACPRRGTFNLHGMLSP